MPSTIDPFSPSPIDKALAVIRELPTPPVQLAVTIGVDANVIRRVRDGSKHLHPHNMEKILAWHERRPSSDTTQSRLDIPAHTSSIDSKQLHLDLDALNLLLDRGYQVGKVPLFVLGAGISAPQVPMLSKIGAFIATKLEACLKGLNAPQTTQEDDILSNDSKTALRALRSDASELNWMKEHSTTLSEGKASRREAAELFSALQLKSKTWSPVWQTFSSSFLSSPAGDWDNNFMGMANAEPTIAHQTIATLVHSEKANVISLNFDGLTLQALREIDASGNTAGAISLHRKEDLFSYFGSIEPRVPAAIIKVRGDVFFGTCTESTCPGHRHPIPIERIIDRLRDSMNDTTCSLYCPVCGKASLLLSFSFPGFREKEEQAHPVLWAARRFLAMSTSAIVSIGFSGRWDKYLLDFLFDWSFERRIPFIDVRPPEDQNLIDEFRNLYFKSCPSVSLDYVDHNSCYVRVNRIADDFMSALSKDLK